MATNATLQQLLLPQVILRVISRIRKGQGFMGRWLGFHPDRYDPETVSLAGPNTLNGNNSVRNVVYRVFDKSRVTAKARAPGTGPATVSPNEMGQATIAVARFHQKMNLEYEMLGNLSPMVGPNSQIDVAGQNYIMRQETNMAEQFNNSVEMLAAAMLRDSLYFYMVGDDWFMNFTAPVAPTVGFQVNFQIPSGNKNQLNMLGTGNIIGTSWANTGAPIISDLNSIVAGFVQLTGFAMTDVIINSLMWTNLLLNTSLRNVAGSANTVFNEYDRSPETFPDGMDGVYYKCVLRGMPNITFHICDDVVALNTDIDPSYGNAPSGGSLAKLVPDTLAIFAPQASSQWTEMYHGGEYVVENPGMPGMLRTGYYAWRQYSTQPSVLELISVLNCIPLLYVPKAVAPATVVF